jgi:hypothetical protein
LAFGNVHYGGSLVHGLMVGMWFFVVQVQKNLG